MSIFDDRITSSSVGKSESSIPEPRIGMKVSEILPAWKENKPQEPSTNFANLVKNGWRKNELIYTCSSKKANTASQVGVKVIRKRDGKTLPTHPLKLLLENPNPRMSEFDFVSSIFIFQDFGGIAYYEKIRSRAGKVVQLWPMRPDWVKPLASSDKFIAGYEYGPPGGDKYIIDVDDVLSFPLWDPINFYSGYPPVAVAARTGDLDNALTDYIRLLFQEGGVPPGLLKTKQAIDEAIGDRMRQKWRERYGGYRNWLDPAVLGYDLEYQQVGIGVEQMGLEILDKRNETRICMVMKVPPTVISSLVGLERAILSNAQEFQRDWWVNDLIPMYKNLNDNFRNQLIPDFGDDIDMMWDFAEVPALSSMLKEKKDAALEQWKSSAITRNQYNEAVGLPSLGPRGEVFLMTVGQVEVPTAKPKLERAPVVTDPNAADDDEEDVEDDPKNILPSADLKALKAPNDEERLKMEKRVKSRLEKYFAGQLERIEGGMERFQT